VCDVPVWLDAPGVYRFYAMVDPEWRRRGIAQALLARLEQYAEKQGAARLISDCLENMEGSIRFLERSGFQQSGLRFESVCDLTAFDESAFAGGIERVTAAGYELTTLAAERRINFNADRDLYELDEAISQDIPWPGGLKASISYENFRRMTLDGPDADPAAIFIAKRDGVYAGYTAASFRSPHIGHTGMTGVRREHRGQGLALALKLRSFHVMKERGCTETLTHNDTANQAILALNRKLGYQKRPGVLLWEKML
jgi:mycothiol synthase